MREAFTWIALFVMIFVYFLPALVAWIRNHHNAAAIFVLDLCLGWSVIGWAVALVWASTATPGPERQ